MNNSTRNTYINLEQLRNELKQSASNLVQEWLPAGRFMGRGYLALNPTRTDNNLGSFIISISGDSAGKWIDHATNDKGGDFISLHYYINKQEYMDSARELAAKYAPETISSVNRQFCQNYTANKYYESNHQEFNKITRYNQSNRSSSNSEPNTCFQNVCSSNTSLPGAKHSPNYDGSNILQKEGYIQKIWGNSNSIMDSPVHQYLDNRGIKITRTDLQEIWDIRYNPKLYHTLSKKYYPSMIAGIKIYPSNNITAIHITYLNSTTGSKADIAPNRKISGSIKGGAVQIYTPVEWEERLAITEQDNGKVSNDPKYSINACNTLYLAEGIETALSVYKIYDQATWAVLSANNYQDLILPKRSIVSHIVICADNDNAGIEKAKEASKKWQYMGYETKIISPKQADSDFNNLIRR